MQRNQIDLSLIPCYLPEQLPQNPVDLVMANILSGPLVALAQTLLDLLKPQGTLVLSGILATQVDTIVAAYAQHLTQLEIQQSGDWIRISGQKS